MGKRGWLKVKHVVSVLLSAELVSFMLVSTLFTAVEAGGSPPAAVYAAEDRRDEIELSLYNAEYYEKANDDVAVALNYDAEALYQHWLNYGKAEGRNASMVFNAKYYLEVNPQVAAEVGNDYVAAYEHFVNEGLLAGLESSPVFSVEYYLEANTDVANAFNSDYVMAARHFNESAIAEGRSGSGNFDYTVYRECNTDVAALYGDYVQGYYIHYINHGRAEGRTGGLGVSDSGTTGEDTGDGDSGNVGGDTDSGDSGTTGGSTGIDETAPSYRIFDAAFYLERYPSLANTVGTDANTLYLYWINEGVAQGQTASPVIVPEEYLALNADVAEAFGDDHAAAITHFLNNGILEGRTGSYEFDYSIYAACNTDVGGVFEDDKVGYYFHYVKYGKAENRTAAVYVPPTEDEPVVPEDVTVTSPEGMVFVSSFNENGYLVEQKYYDANGTLLGQNTVETYYDSGRVSKVACVDGDGNSLGTVSYGYTNGKVSKRTMTNEAGSRALYIAEFVGTNTDGNASCNFYSVDAYTTTVVEYTTDGEIKYSTRSEYGTDGLRDKFIRYYADGTVEYYTLYEYNENGQTTKYTRYSVDGTVLQYVVNNYENGNLQKTTTYLADGSITAWTEYEYHDNGNTKKKLFYDADGTLTSYYIYDENGNQTETKTNWSYTDGSDSGYYIRKFENGVKREETKYNSEGVILQYATYHENGKIKKNAQYDNGILVYYTIYDENGVKIETSSKWSSSDGSYGYYIRQYENGYEVKETQYDSNGTVLSYAVSERDDNGNLKKKTNYAGDGTVAFWIEYAYDRNWEKKTIYFQDGTVNYWIEDEFYDNGALKAETTCFWDGMKEYVEYDIQGNRIKSVRWSYYNGTYEGRSESEYENGKVVTYKRYNQNDELEEYDTYQYCADGSYTQYSYNSKGICTYETEYNSNNQCIKYIRYSWADDGTYSGKAVREYSPTTGKEIKYATYDADDVLEGYELYEYDETGRNTKRISYDGDENLEDIWEFYEDGTKRYDCYRYYGGNLWYTVIYDSEYNQVTCTWYKWTDGTLYSYEVEEYIIGTDKVSKATTYDGEGTMKEYTLYEHYDNDEVKKSYRYNSENQLKTMTEYDTEGESTRTVSYTYHNNGNLYYTDDKYTELHTLRTYYEYDGSVKSYTRFEYREFTWTSSSGGTTSVTTLVSAIDYDADQQKGSYIIYEYLQVGYGLRMTKETYYNADDTIDYYLEYEYDSYGNQVKESKYDGNGNLISINYN